VPKTRNVILLVLFAGVASNLLPWVRERSVRQPAAAQAAGLHRLELTLPESTLRDVSISRAVAMFEAEAGRPITADWQRLREQGANPDARVPTLCRSIPLTYTLDEVLELAVLNDADDGPKPTTLSYTIGPRGEVTIRLGSEVAAETSVLEVYDIRRMFDADLAAFAPLIEGMVTMGSCRSDYAWQHAVCRFEDGRLLILQTPERQAKADYFLAALKTRLQPDVESTRLFRRLRGEEAR
jgi:hypothetical protein